MYEEVNVFCFKRLWVPINDLFNQGVLQIVTLRTYSPTWSEVSSVKSTSYMPH